MIRNTHTVGKVVIPWIGGSSVRTIYKVVDNLGVVYRWASTREEAERIAALLSEPPPDE
tara:strand:+ start:63 stop:239 length:177 start_codon:yes stop_codon:yes gene_type:complete